MRLWTTLACLFLVKAAVPPVDQAVFSPSKTMADDFVASNGPNLNDLLTVERRANIFYDYLREFRDVSTRLGSSDHTTVITPINHAIIALPRKPHQGPVDQKEGMPQIQREMSNKEYLENWVKAHVVAAEIKEGEKEYETLQGKTVKVSKDGSTWKVDGKSAVGVKKASNGLLILVDFTLSVE